MIDFKRPSATAYLDSRHEHDHDTRWEPLSWRDWLAIAAIALGSAGLIFGALWAL